jgi:hypothetical protein
MRVWRRTTGSTFIRSGIKVRLVEKLKRWTVSWES